MGTSAPSAVIVPPGGGTQFAVAGDRFVRKDGPDANFTVIEYTGVAHAPGPPLHVHHAFDEAWYILEGWVEFAVGDRREVCEAGAYVRIPRGVVHTFRVRGETAARWIGILAPGRYVALIQELDALLPGDSPPDPIRIAELFRAYDSEIVGPPLD